jgi:hypothetical protein
MSSAKKSELKPVTTSKVSSANGRSCMSPASRTASGTRSRAIASRPSAASMPATCAPRSAAARRNAPVPQPRSSTSWPSTILRRSIAVS